MFTEILFITIIFIILIIVALFIRVPKATLPLTFIYLLFTSYLIVNEKKTNRDESLIHDNYIYRVDGKNKKSSGKKKKNIDEKRAYKPVPINLAEKSLKPKPLTFNPNKKDKNYKLKSFTEINKLKKNKLDEKDKSILLLKEIKICKGIKNRNPIGVGKSFSSNTDSLFCYTIIQNNGEKKEIKHVWYFENEVKSQIKYNIRRSNIYRSWTLKKINKNEIGKWKVEIQNSNGDVLGSTGFNISKN